MSDKNTNLQELTVDRKYGKYISRDECLKILFELFEDILPQHGYLVRNEQISLAEHILMAISRRQTTLAEAEVGTGKTLAYLVPAILAKRGRLNDFWNRFFYPEMSMVAMAHMPVVVATSSIALQKAIVRDYIPALSKILIKHGIINAPITAAIRKGREHYVCQSNLEAQIKFERNLKTKHILESLLEDSQIDLAEVDGLTPYIKRKISVPERCPASCPHRDSAECSYLRFRTQVQSPEIDVQICNHNYLIADTRLRAQGRRPLIPNYQSLIIDEAHKFLGAARSMYGLEVSAGIFGDMVDSVSEISFDTKRGQRKARKYAKMLHEEGQRLFYTLMENALMCSDDIDSSSLAVDIDEETISYLRSLKYIAGLFIETLEAESVDGGGDGLKSYILWELEQLRSQLDRLISDKLICWIDSGGRETSLWAIPKDLDNKLYDDQWSKGIPTVLTSGTLSAGGDFRHVQRSLGLEKVGIQLISTSKPSPFDYRENALLYISEDVPFPVQGDNEYLAAVTDEIEQLILASHGHAAVLFTSYNTMGLVYAKMQKRDVPFPMFRLSKGDVREIERFKKSGNGVLFASGTLWEGINIPGDALSMLIIVKLPFAVPDPISEYEQTLYKDMKDFKNKVIVPEMLIKLRQGFGRLIRTETDTGAVAILDSRVRKKGIYRERVIRSLPSCNITSDMDDVEDFIRAKKSPEYYM